MKEKVLVIEPCFEGHYLVLYARRVTISLLNEGFEVVLITSKGLPSEIESDLVQDGIEVRKILSSELGFKRARGLGKLIWQLKLHRDVVALLDDVNMKFKFLVYPSIEHFNIINPFLGIPFKGGVRVSGILMLPSFHRAFARSSLANRLKRRIEKWLTLKLIQNPAFNAVGVIDVSLLRWLECNSESAAKLLFIPEPTTARLLSDESPKARFSKGEAKDITILVAGQIEARKGVMELVEGADIFCKSHRDFSVKIVIAGRFACDFESIFKKFICNFQDHIGIKIINRYLTDNELVGLIKRADIGWVGYRRPFSGSSGMLYNFASFGIPVISNHFGLVGELVTRYRSGLACQVDSPWEVASAIEKIISNYGDTQIGCSILVRAHAEESFEKSVVRLVELSG